MKQKEVLRQLYASKIIKFVVTGILNTIFGYAVYAALLFSGTHYLAALLLATIIGVMFNYFSFGYFVFNGYREWMVFIKFIIAYAVIYGFNAIALSVLIIHFLLSPYVGQIICVPPSVLLSWMLMNYWVFKRF